ncbi:hypothetical protein B0H21DRAFT_561601 [Amylocystis lapponica]|nr:hypothetical protein B0H21DRAFT_561601 [Amylocystis lapponica]
MHPATALETNATEEEDEYDEGDDDYDEGDDIEAEAQDMARRLQEQLRADIAKAQQEAAATIAAQHTQVSLVPSIHTHSTPRQASASTSANRQTTAIVTMKAIISFASRNPIVHATLSTYTVPSAGDANLLDVFQSCISSGVVSKNAAKPLSQVVLSLSKSDFFASRNSSITQADRSKRKRDHLDDSETGIADARAYKRAAIHQPDLIDQISEAVRLVSHTFTSSATNILEPAVIASIQPQLHQIFLFAVTSTPCASSPYKAGALQELAGLVQMLGVLSGVHIGSGTSPSHPDSWTAHPTSADIGAAVYPCLVPACNKTFHRLYSLRAHQRTHTLVDRPYRCTYCPASFVRNHDLKRHARLHDKKAWRCSGCGKVFSRRDAIKRHQDNRGRSGGKTRGEPDGGESACACAEIEEVEVDKPNVDDEASRRAKLWNGIAAGHTAQPPDGGPVASASGHGGYGSGNEAWPLEEGEVVPGVIEQAQTTVLQLLGLLQAYVARSTGMSPPPGQPQAPVPGSSTLASVIANAQSASTMSLQIPPAAGGQASAGPSPFIDINPTSSSNPMSTSLSLSWLSEDQTRLLEQAITQAASAAQAQAEAEAALEEEGDEDEDDGETHGID